MGGERSKGEGSPQYLSYRSGRTCFFADRDYELEWARGDGFWPGAEGISLLAHKDSTALLSGSMPPVFPLKYRLHTPSLRPGIDMRIELVIQASASGKPLPGRHTQAVHVFSGDLLCGRETLLRETGVTVYGSGEDDQLPRILSSFKIPHSTTNELARVSGKWLLMLAPDFDESPGLFQDLLSRMHQGLSVLVLLPKTEGFTLPPPDAADSFRMSGEEELAAIDQRLGAHRSPAFRENVTRFRLIAMGDEAGISASSGAGPGYPWAEWEKGGTRLILCGWDLTNSHDNDPGVGLFLLSILSGSCADRPTPHHP